jgi:hypothetical protein
MILITRSGRNCCKLEMSLWLMLENDGLLHFAVFEANHLSFCSSNQNFPDVLLKVILGAHDHDFCRINHFKITKRCLHVLRLDLL